MKIFCVGDYHNVECPHCGKINHEVSRGIEVEFQKVIMFSKPCYHCGKTVYYEASWEIRIVAEKFSPMNP